MVIRIEDILGIDKGKGISKDFTNKLTLKEEELLVKIISRHYRSNVYWFIARRVGEINLGMLSIKMKSVYKEIVRHKGRVPECSLGWHSQRHGRS